MVFLQHQKKCWIIAGNIKVRFQDVNYGEYNSNLFKQRLSRSSDSESMQNVSCLCITPI